MRLPILPAAPITTSLIPILQTPDHQKLPINVKKYSRQMRQLQKISVEMPAIVATIRVLPILELYGYEERYTSTI
jgi:hypothetical protein